MHYLVPAVDPPIIFSTVSESRASSSPFKYSQELSANPIKTNPKFDVNSCLGNPFWVSVARITAIHYLEGYLYSPS